MSIEELTKAIGELRDIMISVATGGVAIQIINDEYRIKYQEVGKALKTESLENPNPHSDLWKWYGRWSSGGLPTYQSRREYIINLYEPLLSKIHDIQIGKTSSLDMEPTGWNRVDRNVDKLKKQLEEAKNEEDFQSVGLLCREALISVAQEVYNPTKHKTLDGVSPSPTDAKRMLEAYIKTELSGQSNETARRVIKAALDLAVELQHKRTAIFKDASLCALSTFTVINLISIISGHINNNSESI